MSSLKRVLMERDGMTGVEADKEIKSMLNRVFEGENPETILFEDYRLEPDYVFDII